MLETPHDDVDISSSSITPEYQPSSKAEYAQESISDLETYLDMKRTGDISADLQPLKDETISHLSAFKDHPTLVGVQTLSLSLDKIPSDITIFVQSLGKEIASFSAVKSLYGIDAHPHKDDGDIYLGGSGNVSVDVRDDQGVHTNTPLSNNFVVTYPGEVHGVQQDNHNKEELFFSVKFK